MKKILMIGNNINVKGGISTVIRQILRFDWRSKGYDLTFIPTYNGGRFLYKILYFLHGYFKIRKMIKNHSIDIVYMHMSYKGSFYRKYFIHKLCKKYNIPDIIHLHGSQFEKWFLSLKNKNKRKVDDLMVNAKCWIVLGEKWYNIIRDLESKTNLLILENSVFDPNCLSKYSEKFKVLFMGVLIQRKGIYDLVKAFDIIINRKKYFGINLIIAGAGPEEENLRKYIKMYNLENSIDLLGWVSENDKKNVYKNVQLLVLPSYYEGLPISILEAMSYGLPIVASNVGDVSSAVKNDLNGYLIKSGDYDALADSIIKIYTDSNKWENMSKYSYFHFKNHFDEENYFDKLCTIFNDDKE